MSYAHIPTSNPHPHSSHTSQFLPHSSICFKVDGDELLVEYRLEVHDNIQARTVDVSKVEEEEILFFKTLQGFWCQKDVSDISQFKSLGVSHTSVVERLAGWRDRNRIQRQEIVHAPS